MKKIFSLALCIVMMLGILAGCSSVDPAQETGTAETGGSVTTDGSTSMEKLMEIYGEVYKKTAGVTIHYNPTGSGAGIQAVSEGRCDIGLASRNLKAEEEASGLQGTVVAIDGIAVVVNPQNPVSDLTLQQLADLYTGKITSWKELGGADIPVVLIGREAGSGTRDGFEAVTGTEDVCRYAQELSSTGDVITTVAGNPGAVGYASLSAVKDNVKALSVDSVAPSEQTVQDGSYAVQRNFVMVTKADTALSDAAQAFLEWVVSPEADEYVKKAGCVPIVH